MTDVLIFDPIPLKGGSKTATEQALTSWPGLGALSVITASPSAWTSANIRSLPQTAWLNETSGLAYYRSVVWQCLVMVWAILRQPADLIIGASSPHVDVAAFITARLTRRRFVQFVHGPCPDTRITRYVLQHADETFALTSIELPLTPHRLTRFQNGIRLSDIAFTDFTAKGIFWAASTMPWKGLDLMIEASKDIQGPVTVACIVQSAEEQQQLPDRLPKATWHFDPPNLAAIRAKHSVFVSTSTNEPFGLSILESMVAGLCPVIPADGAYWDQILIDGEDCLKYSPQDVPALATVLEYCINNPERTREIGQAAHFTARKYEASDAYKPLHHSLDQQPWAKL